ncbi:MAG TPA: hypothetical protein VEB63_08340 [Chitinophagaceae bacterium]|nr:hypothetical protein [Chitinophagaceae bacterium]
MKHSRNYLVLVKGRLNERAIEQQVECLNELLMHVETPGEFCRAHELVNRNHITTRANLILRESARPELRSFRFLINKN